MKIWFTLFENEKWSEKASRSRSKKWNFSRILEKFFRIKKILRFWSKYFSFCKLRLWNFEKGETCEKSWVSNVWVTFNCIAISGIIYQILISDFRFGKASFSSENLTLILVSVGKKFLIDGNSWYMTPNMIFQISRESII